MNNIKTSQDLIDLYQAMDDSRKKSLSDFADFLYGQAEPISKEVQPPDDVPRPQQETVVGAIKRLKMTYHMIGSMSVFSEASALMTDHMVKGRDVVEVIDEMEVLFEEAYKALVQENSKNSEQQGS
ncbi:MAG: Crp/Fnr family transcriptional regulator [Gammaproteobacteria bacterium]